MRRNDSVNEQLLLLKAVVSNEKSSLRSGKCKKKRSKKSRSSLQVKKTKKCSSAIKKKSTEAEGKRRQLSFDPDDHLCMLSEYSDDEIVFNAEIEADLLIQAIDIKHNEETLRLYFTKWLRRIFQRTVASRSKSSMISDCERDELVDAVIDTSSDVLFDFT